MNETSYDIRRVRYTGSGWQTANTDSAYTNTAGYHYVNIPLGTGTYTTTTTTTSYNWPNITISPTISGSGGLFVREAERQHIDVNIKTDLYPEGHFLRTGEQYDNGDIHYTFKYKIQDFNKIDKTLRMPERLTRMQVDKFYEAVRKETQKALREMLEADEHTVREGQQFIVPTLCIEIRFD